MSIVQAALGTELTLETLDGEQAIEIQPGTQHGAQIRLRGLGVPSLRTGRRGDLVCEVAVEVPRNLTRRGSRAARAVRRVCAARTSGPDAKGLFSRIRSAFQ